MTDISWFYNLVLYFSRRLLHDDARGVGETLNETVCVANNCEGLTVKYILPTNIFTTSCIMICGCFFPP